MRFSTSASGSLSIKRCLIARIACRPTSARIVNARNPCTSSRISCRSWFFPISRGRCEQAEVTDGLAAGVGHQEPGNRRRQRQEIKQAGRGLGENDLPTLQRGSRTGGRDAIQRIRSAASTRMVTPISLCKRCRAGRTAGPHYRGRSCRPRCRSWRGSAMPSTSAAVWRPGHNGLPNL